MAVAPHENREIELVLNGTKPLASLERCKQPELFELQEVFSRSLSRCYHTDDLVTITLPKNEHLHAVFALLTSSKAAVIVRSKAEKQRMLGRLFGYTEKDIDDFIQADLGCACGQCAWSEHD